MMVLPKAKRVNYQDGEMFVPGVMKIGQLISCPVMFVIKSGVGEREQ
jgi:hypothetical protein